MEQGLPPPQKPGAAAAIDSRSGTQHSWGLCTEDRPPWSASHGLDRPPPSPRVQSGRSSRVTPWAKGGGAGEKPPPRRQGEKLEG